AACLSPGDHQHMVAVRTTRTKRRGKRIMGKLRSPIDRRYCHAHRGAAGYSDGIRKRRTDWMDLLQQGPNCGRFLEKRLRLGPGATGFERFAQIHERLFERRVWIGAECDPAG